MQHLGSATVAQHHTGARCNSDLDAAPNASPPLPTYQEAVLSASPEGLGVALVSSAESAAAGLLALVGEDAAEGSGSVVACLGSWVAAAASGAASAGAGLDGVGSLGPSAGAGAGLGLGSLDARTVASQALVGLCI
jgi:hypothetical protein